MAKGKNNINKVGSPRNAWHNATSTDQEPTTEELQEDAKEEEEEQWEFVKIIDQAKEPCICRTEGCENKALVVWRSSLDPKGENVWPLCEGCQESDFGGYPEDVAPSAAAVKETTDEKSEETEEGSSCRDSPSGEGNLNDTLTPNDTKKKSNEDVEQWDFVKVIDQAKEPCGCRTENCKNEAVAVWQSNFDTKGEDVWPLCEECQEEDFGGWPDELTARGTATKTIDKIFDKVDVNPPDDATDEAEGWDLKNIIPKQEIVEFPIQCEDPGCNLLAAVVWVNNSNPGEKWRGCLDCQVKI